MRWRKLGILYDFNSSWQTMLCLIFSWLRKENINTKITLTFLVTFKIRYPIHVGLRNEVEFLARGEYYSLTMTELIAPVGIYDEEFIGTPTFKALLVVWNGVMTSNSFLSTISRGFYNSFSTKGSSFNNPVYRFLLYILACSTIGRTDSKGVVNSHDMFQL